MSFEITNTKDQSENAGQTALVYAESGTGKTTLLGTLPGKTLLISLESGTLVLRDADIDVIEVNQDLANLKEVMEFVESRDCWDKYDNICMDSASELEKFMLIRYGNASKLDGVPELGDYNRVYYKMRDYMRRMRDLRNHGVNVIVTALEARIPVQMDEGVVKNILYPLVAGKIVDEIVALFDIVTRMEISQKEATLNQRFLRLGKTDKIMAKDRGSRRIFCTADAKDLFQITETETATETTGE